MGIDVEMLVPHIEMIDSLLKHCPPEVLAYSLDGGDYRVIGLENVALAEDSYGRDSSLTAELEDFLARHADEDVLWFDDLASEGDAAPDWSSCLGVWRPNFLRYLRAAARSQQTWLEVHYSHERGDWLYESAEWIFNFGNTLSNFESLSITGYDGGPARWSVEARRMGGGPAESTFKRYDT